MKTLIKYINENIDKQLYFGTEDWDAPIIATKNNGDFKEIDSLYVSEDMYSFVILSNGTVCTAENESHNGAILNGMLKIHHLKTVDQLEHKFGEDFDSIAMDVRKRCKCEGRFWIKYNILQFTGKNYNDNPTIINNICKALNVSVSDISLLGDPDNDDNDYKIITKYKE